jgi:hypothetical protein
MRLDDFEVTINCKDQGVESGASALAATSFGAAVLVAASLF